MSSFVGLYTGLSGIQASQTGLDITSHNVANANTPGYTRQRVELAPRPTYQSANGRVGTGVDVQSIARLRDNFLDDRFRAAVGQRAEAGVRAEFHASLEFLSGEPDLGLTGRIDTLWAAAEAWANDPNDPSTRRQVLTELASIADGFRATATAWDQLGEDTAAQRDVAVTQINDTLASLEDMNRKLANADPSRIGADLLDQRDLLVDRLAELTGATSKLQEDGTVTVTLGGAPTTELLSHPAGRATFSIDTTQTPAPVQVSLAGAAPGDTPVDVDNAISGALGGLHRVLEQDLPAWRTQLDELAGSIAGAVNAVNTGGIDADGDAGVELLTFSDPGDPAGSIELTSDDISVLAAAQGVVGTAPPPYDGTNARALADLRTTRTAADGTTAAPGDPDASTLEARLADMVVGLAGVVRSSRSSADAANGVATGAQLARASEHGVSLDEEMVGLVRYQRALEASARVMTTVDQALDTLVNRVGIVGR